jgi:hypothetical protein
VAISGASGPAIPATMTFAAVRAGRAAITSGERIVGERIVMT